MLVSTAKSISVDDAVKIVRGGETSVTDYFAGKLQDLTYDEGELAQALAPLGLDAGFASPIRRWAQIQVRRQMGYLPYL